MAMPLFPSETSQDPEQSRNLLEAEVQQRHEVSGQVSPQGGRWLRAAGLAGVLLAACAAFVMLTTTAGPVSGTSSPPMQAIRGKQTTVHKVSDVMELALSCSATEKECDGACVDVSASMFNCGACGTKCGLGQACIGGRCKCLTTGHRACAVSGAAAVCADLDCDDNYCGTCNTKCDKEKGQKCLAGRCQCMDPTPNPCFTGNPLMLDTCVNFMTDDNNCGSCGTKCNVDKGQKCRGGHCECIDTANTGKITTCSGTCVDVLTDPQNCGRCGNVCPGTTECISGTCQCDLGSGLCPTGGSNPPQCFDLQISQNHCGRCSTVCPEDQECYKGNCQCRALKKNLCGATCVDVQIDNQHCGGCNRACAGGLKCDDGTCKCETGTFCKGSCKDLSKDTENCGTCGNKCGAGQTCAAGSCQCLLDQQLCSGVCINFKTDPKNCGGCGVKCPKAQQCKEGFCQCVGDGNNAEDDTKLDACGTPVGSLCTNRMTDRNNCGKCNNKCPAAQVCKDGYCQCVDLPDNNLINACGTPLGSKCVDFKRDTNHCGGCDNQCSEGQQCVEGVCQCVDTTNTGKTYRCGTPVGGYTCVNLQSDAQNCGTCGNQCPAGQECKYGICECADTSKRLCHGQCVDFLRDNLNCGGCGKICPHQKVCNNGNCECVSAHGKINACGSVAKGFACVNFMNDDNHCGSCKNQCPSAQSCREGSCQCPDRLKACGPSCVDIYTDPLNCGSCGNLCPTGQPCLGGVCQGVSDATCSGDQCFCTSESPCTAGLSVVADGEFSSCNVYKGSQRGEGYAYVCPLNQKWTCAGSVVCIKSDSKPWGSPDAVDNGQYLLGLQTNDGVTTSITQTVNVVKGIRYTLSLYAASRTKGKNSGESYQLATLKITVPGVEVYRKQLSAQPLDKISITFVAGDSTATITLSNDSPGGDRTVFLSNVAITPNQVPVADGDFSGCSASVPSDSVLGYNETCPSSSWSCSTQGTQYTVVCIASGNVHWGYPTAPGSSPYLVGLQKRDAKISQTVDVIAGTSYTLKVYAASRNGNLATLQILVDGVSQSLSTLPPLPGTLPGTLSEVSCTFVAQTSTATISFLNRSPASADQTVFLSNVIITTTASCETGHGICGGVVKDLASDPKNCGACGNVCPQNSFCSNSRCRCEESDNFLCPAAGGLGKVCTPVDTDSNCGGCGVACAGTTPKCINKRCQAVATGDEVKCSCDGQCSNSVKCYDKDGPIILLPTDSTCAVGQFCTLATGTHTFATADLAKTGAADFHCKDWQPLLQQDKSCPFDKATKPVYTQTPRAGTCFMDVKREYFQQLHFTNAGFTSTTSERPVTGEKYMMFAQWRRCSGDSQSSCTESNANEIMNICWAQSALPLEAAGRFEGLNPDARSAAIQPRDPSYQQFHGESTPNHQDTLCFFNGEGNNGKDREDRRLHQEHEGGANEHGNIKHGNVNPSWNCMGQTAVNNILSNNGIRGPKGQYWYSVKWYTTNTTVTAR